MKPFLFDSHAHLTSSTLSESLDSVLKHAQEAGVTSILNICTDQQSIEKGALISDSGVRIYHAAAVHPHDAEKEGKHFFPMVEECARHKRVVAIGETGLDYHYQHSSPEVQQVYLRKHLKLAMECNLPVILHCRDAFIDLFRIMDEAYQGATVLHCFTGNMTEAQQVLSRGWYLSLSGIVTFKKSSELREVAKMVPLERLLIETDAPYLAPQNKRGHTNEPAFLVETATVIAAVKGITLKELAEATTRNAQTLFEHL